MADTEVNGDEFEVKEHDEDEIIRLAQKKDINAFESIYKKYLARIYTLVFRMVGNPMISEEITQDIFVRLWQKIGLYKGKNIVNGETCSFYTWFHRLAVNVIIKHKRLKSSQFTNEIYLEDVSYGDEKKSKDMDVSMDIDKAVSSLPHEARHVFILHDVEGYRHEDIARIKNISVGTSKHQLHRAKQIIRRLLKYEM